MRRVVWSAVLAALLAVAAIVVAVLGFGEIALACGLASVSAAVLSNREK